MTASARRGERIREALLLNGYPDEDTVPCPLADLDELVAQVAAAEQERDEAHRDHLEAHIRAEAASARADRLRLYATHYPDCRHLRTGECTCGLNAALASPAPDRTEAECDGSGVCKAERHIHGCYSDDGTNCDHLNEHGLPAAAPSPPDTGGQT